MKVFRFFRTLIFYSLFPFVGIGASVALAQLLKSAGLLLGNSFDGTLGFLSLVVLVIWAIAVITRLLPFLKTSYPHLRNFWETGSF